MAEVPGRYFPRHSSVTGDILQKLKDTHVTLTERELAGLCERRIKSVNEVKEATDQRIEENKAKIKEQTYVTIKLKEELSALTEIVKHKQSELTKRKDRLKEIEVEKKKVLKEVRDLELEKNKLIPGKVNIHDQQMLDEGTEKLKLYKELTGIKWDYAALNEGAIGYVTNKIDYIHHFSYKNEDHKTVSDNLWHEIFLSTRNNTSESESDEENTVQNK